jgi:hypothetical protein
MRVLIILPLLVLALGCGEASKASLDTSTDMPVETTPDGTPDVPVDTPIDTPVETSTDAHDPHADTGCPAGWGDCNHDSSDGCETDLTSTAAHCGACDHDCLGAACVASMCEVIHVADPLGTSTGPWNGFLALGPANVYYGYAATPSGGVAMASKDGSGSACIECDVGFCRELATDATSVYWSNEGTGEIKKAPLGGGTVVPLWSGPTGTPIAVDPAHVFWHDATADTLMMAGLDGSSPMAIATAQPDINSIATQGGHVYWISASNLMEMDIASRTPNTLHSGLNNPKSVAVDATHVYWVEGDWDLPNNEINRTPKSGGSIDTLATHSAFAIALDASHVYVASNYSGDIYRVRKSGGTPEMLATGQPFPLDIAVDAVAVYFSSETDGGVGKVAK